jgi:hypothetical protein
MMLTPSNLTTAHIRSCRAGAKAAGNWMVVDLCDAAEARSWDAIQRLCELINAADLALTESEPMTPPPASRPLSCLRVILDPVDGRDGCLAEVVILADDRQVDLRQLMLSWLSTAIPARCTGSFVVQPVQRPPHVIGWWIEAEAIDLDELAFMMGVQFGIVWSCRSNVMADGIWLGEIAG